MIDLSKCTVMIVDDTQTVVRTLLKVLEADYAVSVATCGKSALEVVRLSPPDLILLDIMMPGIDGYEVCRLLKKDHKTRDIPIIFMTGIGKTQSITKSFKLGAEDYITKPFEISEVRARVKTHLSLAMTKKELANKNITLDEKVRERTAELKAAYEQLNSSQYMLKSSYLDTIFRLNTVAEYKDQETASHIKRVGTYCAYIATELGQSEEYVELVTHAAPMHDIGKVAIPSEILLKTGKLSTEEFALMKTHTTSGERLLKGSGSKFLQLAERIAATHHERWDGLGYPQGLKGEEIPLEGRIMNIADQYDALRGRRPYKSPFDHEKTVKIIAEGDGRTMPEHFDPTVLDIFKNSHKKFEEIYEELKD